MTKALGNLTEPRKENTTCADLGVDLFPPFRQRTETPDAAGVKGITAGSAIIGHHVDARPLPQSATPRFPRPNRQKIRVYPNGGAHARQHPSRNMAVTVLPKDTGLVALPGPALPPHLVQMQITIGRLSYVTNLLRAAKPFSPLDLPSQVVQPPAFLLRRRSREWSNPPHIPRDPRQCRYLAPLHPAPNLSYNYRPRWIGTLRSRTTLVSTSRHSLLRKSLRRASSTTQNLRDGTLC